MKRILTLLFIFSSIFIGHAQIQKGSLLLDGQFNIGSSVGQEDNVFSVNVAPAVGVFLSDRFVLGAGLGVGYGNIGGFDGGSLAIAPFARHYFSGDINKPIRWFATAGTGINFLFGDTDSDPIYSLNLGVGVNYFLNKQVALEGILGYVNQDLGGSPRSNLISLRLGLQLFLHPEGDDTRESLSIEKANKLFVGSSFALFTNNPDNIFGSTSITLNPNIGWFLSEHFAVGSSVLLSYNSIRVFDGISVGATPFVRFYPQKSTGAFQWFLTAEAGIQYFSNNFDESLTGVGGFDNSGWLKNFRAGTGLNWFLSENVALEGILSYRYQETPTLPAVDRNISFDVGFQFFLARKK